VQKAEDMLQRAEDYYQRKQGRTPIGTAARGATQMAEDARVLTLRKKESEREEAARRAAADAQAKAEADAESAKRDAEQAQAQANEDARKRAEAEQARAEAERQQATMLAQQQASEAQLAAARNAADDAQRRLQDAQNQMAQAEQERQQAEMQSQQAQQQTQEAQRQAQQAIQEKEQMRARLREQLNQVLQTRDTARGLIVSMPDVLFDFNKYTLKSEARERLAKISGIVEAYPGLKLQVEGHTDSIGSDEYNLQLSEKRADSVRAYLVSNGVRPDSVSAQGFGKADPVADNSTASGRKLNRRVDMVVSGDVIGTELSTPSIEAVPQSANR